MSRIVINTIGSTGDLFPFIALGQGLKTRGHSVLFAVNKTMHPTIQKAGLDVVECGPPLGEEDARQMVHLFDGRDQLKQLTWLMREWLIPSTKETYPQLLAACRGADALLATSIQFAAPLVTQKLGIRQITASLTPCQFPTAYEAPIRWPHTGMRWFNRLGWGIAKFFVRMKFNPALNAVRAELGFGPVRGAPSFEEFSPELLLLGSSSHFSPRQPDWPAALRMTGYWFYDAQDQQDWQPSEDLRRFVARGPQPVVLSLGSMVQRDPAGIVKLHVDALRALKQRVIIQQGWAKLSVAGLGCNPDDVIECGFVPHAWLFEHAACVIHHGGAGTTARSLRHGKPMVVEAHGFDQPYTARRVQQLGVGAGLHAHQLNPRTLRACLERALAPETRARAAELGAKVRAEDGVKSACELVETLLRT